MPQKGKRGADHRLFMALACGSTVENAARQLGLSESTIYRRLADPDFNKRLQELKADMVRRNAGSLTAAGPEAGGPETGYTQPLA